MKVLAFGEILYDCFDCDAKIGGAPLNLAAHMARLGADAYILSAVGDDKLGLDAVKTAQNLGVRTDYILKSKLPTGICSITYNGGEPIYDLSKISAYDGIKLDNNTLKKIKGEEFDILCFGTLARRCEVSSNSFDLLLNSICFKKIFFDMNLRQSYYTRELIEGSLKAADIVKINRDEFERLKELKLCENEADLCESYNIELLLLTLDKEGMRAYEAKAKSTYHSDKPKNKVISTVGAGDASSACFLCNYLSGERLDTCVKRANLLGDFIVTRPEAIPEYSDELLLELENVK